MNHNTRSQYQVDGTSFAGKEGRAPYSCRTGLHAAHVLASLTLTTLVDAATWFFVCSVKLCGDSPQYN
jgi:hypothetical protein